MLAGGLVRSTVLGSQLHVQAEQPAGHALQLLRADSPAGPWSSLLAVECSTVPWAQTWSVTGRWRDDNYVRGVVVPCPRLSDGSLLRPTTTTPALGVVHQYGLIKLVDVVGIDVDPGFRAYITLP